MALGIFEQLDWLTKKVKALCCIVENGGGGGGGCGDCPVATDGSTIVGNGTLANPLVANFPPVPVVVEGTYSASVNSTSNCNPVFTGDLYYTQIDNTVFVWGTYDNNSDGVNSWSFTLSSPPVVTNNYTNNYDVVGLSAWKEIPMLIDCVPGSTEIRVYSGGTGALADGVYTFSCVIKMQ